VLRAETRDLKVSRAALCAITAGRVIDREEIMIERLRWCFSQFMTIGFILQGYYFINFFNVSNRYAVVVLGTSWH
jgi:hypothetical protein